METPSRSLHLPSGPIRTSPAETKALPPRARAAIDSHTLFAHADRVVIRHGDTDYCLRITSLNKLILTK